MCYPSKINLDSEINLNPITKMLNRINGIRRTKLTESSMRTASRRSSNLHYQHAIADGKIFPSIKNCQCCLCPNSAAATVECPPPMSLYEMTPEISRAHKIRRFENPSDKNRETASVTQRNCNGPIRNLHRKQRIR